MRTESPEARVPSRQQSNDTFYFSRPYTMTLLFHGFAHGDLLPTSWNSSMDECCRWRTAAGRMECWQFRNIDDSGCENMPIDSLSNR